ncbi:transposase family protein [Streptomyces sp. NPDC004284]|uniref:transposase family protein n=1 Tax=Streptomyces sp. NPDC004284 TaxID=3364695 RepID=UPI0036BA181A
MAAGVRRPPPRSTGTVRFCGPVSSRWRPRPGTDRGRPRRTAAGRSRRPAACRSPSAGRTQPIGVACPACAAVSNRVHSVSTRRLEDTPVDDRPVLIELMVRRLHCENSACTRRTFAEQVEGLTMR